MNSSDKTEPSQLHADAFEVLSFKDATAGKRGPIPWQMRNKSLFDEYKEVPIED